MFIYTYVTYLLFQSFQSDMWRLHGSIGWLRTYHIDMLCYWQFNISKIYNSIYLLSNYKYNFILHYYFSRSGYLIQSPNFIIYCNFIQICDDCTSFEYQCSYVTIVQLFQIFILNLYRYRLRIIMVTTIFPVFWQISNIFSFIIQLVITFSVQLFIFLSLSLIHLHFWLQIGLSI